MGAKSKIAVSVVAALATGVVIGLLIAPQKGKKLRKRLKKTAGKFTDTVSNLLTKSKEDIEEITEK